MKIQFIIHADFERPGIITAWARSKGIEWDICRPFAREPLPPQDTFDWLIILGGPQRPIYFDNYPYLRTEIEFIQDALLLGKTTLGFCLGAQLIGEALGAPTEQSPHKEVGIYPITLTEDGKNDPILRGLPQSFPVIHWHNDMPGVTAEARILAYSAGCPRQIIRYRPNVYGIQCHPESTFGVMEERIINCQEDLQPGRFIQTADQILNSDIPRINGRMISILNQLHANFLTHLSQ